MHYVILHIGKEGGGGGGGSGPPGPPPPPPPPPKSAPSVVLLFIIVLRLVCSHYLCGGSCTSSGEGGVPEKEVLRFTEGEGTNVWTRVMNSVWICVFVYMCVMLHVNLD